MTFTNKTIIVTGGGGFFGTCATARFLSAGCNVACLDISDSALSAVPEHPKLLKIPADVTSQSSIDTAVAATVARFGKIDLLWNNAGYQGAICPTLSYPVDDFSRVMNINVTGMFIVLQSVAKSMSTTGGGAIVNTASVAALRCTPAMVAYASSKAAVIAMTNCTAKDLAPNQIRVNAVSPALIGPGMMWDRQNELHAACDSPYFANDAVTVAKNKIGGVPMKRIGSVDEVVDAVEFLLSEKASYITGQNIVVDGGMSAGLK